MILSTIYDIITPLLGRFYQPQIYLKDLRWQEDARLQARDRLSGTMSATPIIRQKDAFYQIFVL
jgi:hypothetical protein